MWAFEILNKKTNELTTIIGYTFADACRRKGYNENDYACMYQEYID